MPKNSIRNLFQHIKEDEDTGERCFSDGPRNHKTDGVIFTPINSPYGLNTVHTLFKWKFLDKQTIDFRAKRVPNTTDEFELFVGVKGGEAKVFHVAFSPQDAENINEDFAKYQKNESAIIECGYNRLYGMWKYVTIRPDKVKPNFVRVVFETLEAISEAITKEEVIGSLHAGHANAGHANAGHANAGHANAGHGGQHGQAGHGQGGHSSNNNSTHSNGQNAPTRHGGSRPEKRT